MENNKTEEFIKLRLVYYNLQSKSWSLQLIKLNKQSEKKNARKMQVWSLQYGTYDRDFKPLPSGSASGILPRQHHIDSLNRRSNMSRVTERLIDLFILSSLRNYLRNKMKQR